MIVILRPGAQKARVEALMSQIKQQGVDIHYSQGATETILGLVGDTTHVDEDWLRASDIVEDVRRVSEPYKLANRRFHPKDTHVNVCGRAVGEGTFTVIAGPCSVESREQLVSIAEDVKRSGATCLRGVQAAHLAVFLSGAGKRRTQTAAGGQEGDRPADCHRNYERNADRRFRGCGRDSGRCAEHAEFPAA